MTQTIDGKEHILGYYSKVLPNACQRYSVTELELFGLLINVSAFKHLLKGCEFDAFVDHSAIVQILKSKEPCTKRLQKLILRLSEYAFKIGYKKGSELVLADFLLRAPFSLQHPGEIQMQRLSFRRSTTAREEDDSEIDRVIPVACSLFTDQDLEETLNPVTQPTERRVTRAYAKQMGIKVPDLFTPKPKTDKPTSESQNNSEGVSDYTPPSQSENIPHTPLSEFDTPYGQAQGTTDSSCNNSTPIPRTDRFKSAPVEPRLVDNMSSKTNSDENFRDVPPELYSPPKPLTTKVHNVIASHIPKQQDLDRLMNVIKRKIIRDYNLPIDMKKLKTEQETLPFFKPVYDYLAYDILPSDKKVAKAIQVKAEQYILCDGILFRLFLNDTDEDVKLQLAIPETLAETIISQYYGSRAANLSLSKKVLLSLKKHIFR